MPAQFEFLPDAHYDLIGISAPMAKLVRFIVKAAPTNSTVLIQGESGTGKELVARAIHRNSKRFAGPFIAINCAALSENLLESELFGHEKGSFTGAVTRKMGRFELAAGGTLFLDEIGELTPSTQAKLLRALQEREIDRVGGIRSIPVDIRLIAATNRNLQAAIREGQFRQDLYYRLRVLLVRTPPLRERREDIPALAHHFISKYAKETGRDVRGISPEARLKLQNYDWPGNVRQFQNVIEQAIVFGSTDIVREEDLPDELFESPLEAFESELPAYDDVVDGVKRQLLTAACSRARGDYKEVARLIRRHPKRVHRLLKEFHLSHLLQPPSTDDPANRQ